MPRYVLLMGSNEAPEAQLERARSKLDQQFGILGLGELIWSDDRDVSERPRYLNQGIEIASPLNADELKQSLRAIEAQLGRRRSPGAGDGLCAIDIDIVLRFSEAMWQVLDAKTAQFDYAREALARWSLLA